jgi:hypothetical protein
VLNKLSIALALLVALTATACDSDTASTTAGGVTPKARALDRFEPDPRHPERDRSKMQNDGCLVKTDDSRVKACVFGKPDASKTVVLFGDSLAMAYFPAIELLAERDGWRLVALTKMGCPPVAAPLYSHRRDRTYYECAEWRERALRKIERDESPDLIFVTGRMSTRATRDGVMLGARRSRAVLERGYVEVLERLSRTGARVVALKDLPSSPRNGPDCVVAHPRDLNRCTFEISPRDAVGFDRVAAQSVPGVELIDLTPRICPGGVCRVVIDGKLVFRDFDHMTPTFARTLAGPIERRLGGE